MKDSKEKRMLGIVEDDEGQSYDIVGPAGTFLQLKIRLYLWTGAAFGIGLLSGLYLIK